MWEQGRLSAKRHREVQKQKDLAVKKRKILADEEHAKLLAAKKALENLAAILKKDVLSKYDSGFQNK